MRPWFRWDGRDLLVRVLIQPRARRDEIAGVSVDCLKIRLAAPPVEGKANARLAEVLGRLFGIPKTGVTLVRGHKGKTKLLRLHSPKVFPPGLGIAPADNQKKKGAR